MHVEEQDNKIKLFKNQKRNILKNFLLLPILSLIVDLMILQVKKFVETVDS